MQELNNIKRYNSSCTVVAYSHRGVSVSLSPFVLELQTSKSIKGTGSCQFVLSPLRDWRNVLEDNDIIAVYFDMGDGRGNIWTFFGFIDRVEKSSVMSEENSIDRYTVYCSDFQKVAERTQQYSNPALLLNADFLKPFGSHLSGVRHMLGGLRASGTPAELAISFWSYVTKYSLQWQLPSGLILYEEIKQPAIVDFVQALAKSNIPYDAISGVTSANPEDDVKNDASGDVSRYRSENISHIVDLSFVEIGAIDGDIFASRIWLESGDLLSFLRGYSNSDINELFFDLRPVVDGYDKTNNAAFGRYAEADPDEISRVDLGDNIDLPEDVLNMALAVVGYSKDDDMLGLNAGGVKYRPAMVMREYPFSTVDGIDISAAGLSAPPSISEPFFVKFATIFNSYPNLTGRHICYDSEALPLKYRNSKKDFKFDVRCLRHLDVVTIRNVDVDNYVTGRGDQECVNLSWVYPQGGEQQNTEYIIPGIQPIVNHVNIFRSGLREMVTRSPFANIVDGSNDTFTEYWLYQVTRWALLLDHWNQHNREYLSGVIETKGRPDIRVGYRLDWEETSESYYVESVTNTWNVESGSVSQSIQVTRGQRNDPFPIYVYPMAYLGGDRGENSRLNTMFKLKEEQNITVGISDFNAPSKWGPSSPLFLPWSNDRNYIDSDIDWPGEHSGKHKIKTW